MQRIKQTLVILSPSINIPYMLIFLFLGCFLTPIQAFISKLYHAHATYTTGNQTEVIFLSVVVELCETVFLNLIPIFYYLRTHNEQAMKHAS